MIELSDDLKHIGSFVGRCFGGLPDTDAAHHAISAVHVHKSLEESDGHVEAIGHLVGTIAERAEDFLSCAATDFEDSFNTIGQYISVEHLPPTPCCLIGKTLLDTLHGHLNGNSYHPSSCIYHT
ncbi:MAG: hypothetical protein HQL01_09000 [Nitrospirae bacterium]|nr:hypothetical protein [Nitrospirota bacterium]